jgi:uncharacterized membrane protein YdbT with pleckstrin-like domain
MSVTGSLSEGEQIRLDLHPHWHQLVMPMLLLPLTVGAASYLFFVVPHGDLRQPLRYLILAAAAVILIGWVLRPFLQWLATRYVVTTRRVLLRDGLLRRHGRDIPLNRISDVSFDSTVVERMLRCGTLTIESAGDHGQVPLTDVPQVEMVQRTIYELVEALTGPTAARSVD